MTLYSSTSIYTATKI